MDIIVGGSWRYTFELKTDTLSSSASISSWHLAVGNSRNGEANKDPEGERARTRITVSVFQEREFEFSVGDKYRQRCCIPSK